MFALILTLSCLISTGTMQDTPVDFTSNPQCDAGYDKLNSELSSNETDDLDKKANEVRDYPARPGFIDLNYKDHGFLVKDINIKKSIIKLAE